MSYMMLSQSLIFLMMTDLSSTMMLHPMLVVNPHIDLISSICCVLVLAGICHKKLFIRKRIEWFESYQGIFVFLL